MKPIYPGRSRATGVLTVFRGGTRGRSIRRPAIRLGRYRFQPAWSMTLLALLLASLMAALGGWQLQRAAAKEQLMAHFSQNNALPALDLNATDLRGPQLTDRHAVVTGRYREAPFILLNNQTQQGRVGFPLFGLFRFAGSDKHLLINRGWVPASAEGRPVIADPTPHLRGQTLRGLLVPMPRSGLRLGELRYQSDAPVMELPYLDLSWLRQVLDVDLQPFVLLLDEPIVEQYRRQRQAAWLNPQRHRGYALQWFSLSLALVIIYIVTNLKRTDRG
jgi:cytochrome oxidase assembly protein ShyY1